MKIKLLLFIVIIFIFIVYSTDLFYKQFGDKTIIIPQIVFFSDNLIVVKDSYLYITKLLDEKSNHSNNYESQETKINDVETERLKQEERVKNKVDEAQQIKINNEKIIELRNDAERFEEVNMYGKAREKYIEIIGIDKLNKESYEKIIELFRLQNNQEDVKIWESIMKNVFKDKNSVN
jgi:vacuolar-type H+-ATPase subunit I/STV1